LRRCAVAALTISVSVVQFACMGACDIWPVRKTLPGGYQLEIFESTNYYVHTKRGGSRRGGPLGGPVSQLGWTDTYIVAWRSVPVWGAQGVGWMIISLASGQIEGTIVTRAIRGASP
jgi:hypothetical protein